MKRAFMGILPIVLLALSNAAIAAPNSNFSATAPTQYEDGNVIPADDALTYRVYCGSQPGGPYNFWYDTPTLVAGTTIDVGSCVQGTPGTYFFVATAISATFGTESNFSNETSRTYIASELGKVPMPPTLFIVE